MEVEAAGDQGYECGGLVGMSWTRWLLIKGNAAGIRGLGSHGHRGSYTIDIT